jgi:hypothetical protein
MEKRRLLVLSRIGLIVHCGARQHPFPHQWRAVAPLQAMSLLHHCLLNVYRTAQTLQGNISLCEANIAYQVELH